MDKMFLSVFAVAVTVSMCIFLRVGYGSDGFDAAGHDSVIQAMGKRIEAQRYEAGIIIASMASAIGILYVNGRKDMRASRIVINRLASALERLPCRPELCTDQKETEVS